MRFGLLGITALALATPAQAAVVSYDLTLDVSKAIPIFGYDFDGDEGNEIWYPLVGSGPVTWNAGDTFDGHISVLDGKSVTIFDVVPTYGPGVRIGIYPTSFDGAAPVHFSFGGVSGDYVGPAVLDAFVVPVGAAYNSTKLTNTSFSFTSLDFSGTLKSGLSGTYSPYLIVYGQPPVPAPPIPELATWAMMLIGFGGIGAALRQRTKTTKPARMQPSHNF